MRREDNHRHTWLYFLNFAEQLHAVHFVHAQIANHQVDTFFCQYAKPLLTAFRRIHPVALADQAHSQQLKQAGIIIHQQQVRRFTVTHVYPHQMPPDVTYQRPAYGWKAGVQCPSGFAVCGW